MCVLFAAACGGYENPETPALASQAQVVEHDIRMPVDMVRDQVGDCPEKTLHLTGTAQFLETFTINDNNFHATLHFNNQGLVAEGVETGTLYHVGRAQSLVVNGSFTNGTYNEHYVVTASTMSAGRGDNRVLQIRYHVTFNANGDVTAYVDDFNVICH